MPAALPLVPVAVADALALVPVLDEPPVVVAEVVALEPVLSADEVSEPDSVVVAVEDSVVVLEASVALFWTWNHVAPMGSPRLVAWTKAAISNPILAFTSAGGLIETNSDGISNPSGWRYMINVYLWGMSPSGGFGAMYEAPMAVDAFGAVASKNKISDPKRFGCK